MSQWMPFVLLGCVVLAAGCGDSGRGRGPNVIDDDAPEAFTTTESGLRYRIRRKGTGKRPDANATVTVDYRGWLDDGKEFDSSYKRGKTVSFRLRGVIPGWTEGLQLVSEGGMIELEVPGNLGYGPRGRPDAGIPANATLHFLVELISIQ